jgi:hypothetical protein
MDAAPDDLDPLLLALAGVEDAVSRIDELAQGPLGAGLAARLELDEACAWAWNRGAAVRLEDLVLHDERLDVRLPDQALTAAHAALTAGRRAAGLDPAELLSPEGVRRLMGAAPPVHAHRESETAALAPSPAPFAPLLARAAAVATADDAEALAAWFEIERATPAGWPALLRAAVLMECWALINPLPQRSYLGAVLVNAVLAQAGRLRRHRLAIEHGRRALAAAERRRPAQGTAEARVGWWLAVFGEAARAARAELDQLRLAHQVAARHARGRRSSSRLPQLISLLAERPLVTAPMVAERLGVSQQAARGLIAELGGSISEITGRRRFRAWRL